ncbi:CHAT domain-containing protein [Actinophytocola sp. NPDC049390]|uniref:CHAT domain-containing protein n=1 Tax=Actinophytocola sp. NPDC049390 TaxID=3363894 RepID=UPI0037B8C1AB
MSFLGWLSRQAVARTDLTTIDALDEADVDDLKVVARLFEVADREPVFVDALSHIEKTLAEHVADRPASSTLFRVISSSLLAEVVRHFADRGYDNEAHRTRSLAAELKPAAPDLCVFYLLSACASVRFHQLPQRVPDAVIRALLVEFDLLSRRVDRGAVLTAAAKATFAAGNLPLLQRVVDRFATIPLSTGYQAIHAMFEGQLSKAAGRMDDCEASMTTAGRLVSRMTRKDPAYAAANAQWDRERANRDLRGSGEYGDAALEDRAAAAMDRRDWAAAADYYDELTRTPNSDHLRATFRVVSEGARLEAGHLEDGPSLLACARRLAADNVALARSRPETDMLLIWLLGKAFEVDPRGPAAVCVADLIGEFRTGVAVDHREHRPVAGTTAAADLTLVDFLRRTPELTTAEDVPFLDTAVVWTHLIDTDDGPTAMVCTVPPGATEVRTRRVHIGPTVFEMIGRPSENRADLTTLSGDLFADLPASCRRVLVVPDTNAWQLPWPRLAPGDVAELAVVPSVAAARRMRPPSLSAHPRVVGVFDESLEGATLELTALSDLADRGVIDFRRVHSIDELGQCLIEDEVDLLTVAVHGSSGDGLEYRMMVPDGTQSPAALLSMRLPPVVVLGCCWSARAPLSRDTTTASVGCLVAGASTVIGGLWDVDDRVAGALLADTYERTFTGTPLPTAFRQAFTALDEDVRPRAAGLGLFGLL